MSIQPNNLSSLSRPPIAETTRVAQSSLTGDTCRESELGLTPGEVHGAYLDLNKQITGKLDTYVEQAGKAKTGFDALMPLVDQMQAMLS